MLEKKNGSIVLTYSFRDGNQIEGKDFEDFFFFWKYMFYISTLMSYVRY